MVSSFTPIRRWLMPCAPSAALTTALTTGLLSVAVAAHAQPDARIGKLDPLDPKASVPAVIYESSFSQYRRLGDEKPVSWREANDTVARIGGWRVYAREAQQPEPMREPMPAAQAMPPASSPQRMAPAHGGHKTP